MSRRVDRDLIEIHSDAVDPHASEFCVVGQIGSLGKFGKQLQERNL